jgi:hypothetical protein
VNSVAFFPFKICSICLLSWAYVIRYFVLKIFTVVVYAVGYIKIYFFEIFETLKFEFFDVWKIGLQWARELIAFFGGKAISRSHLPHCQQNITSNQKWLSCIVSQEIKSRSANFVANEKHGTWAVYMLWVIHFKVLVVSRCHHRPTGTHTSSPPVIKHSSVNFCLPKNTASRFLP